jgi:hypothetical protein
MQMWPRHFFFAFHRVGLAEEVGVVGRPGQDRGRLPPLRARQAVHGEAQVQQRHRRVGRPGGARGGQRVLGGVER